MWDKTGGQMYEIGFYRKGIRTPLIQYKDLEDAPNLVEHIEHSKVDSSVSRKPRMWKGAKETGHVWFNDLRLSHFLYALPTLAIVIVVSTFLIKIPVLSWGWWQALGGHGSVIVLSYGEQDSWTSNIVPLIMVVVIGFWVFRLASNEELQFRRNSQNYNLREILWVALVFGLAHAIMGIPLGVALALSFGGLIFSWHYMRAYKKAHKERISPSLEVEQHRETMALKSATLHHAAYNLLALSVFGVTLIFDILDKTGIL